MKKTPIVISATFTAEPIKTYLESYLMGFLDHFTITFSPYHQVFQELLNKNSVLRQNSGINLLLLRFEDWQRQESPLNVEDFHPEKINHHVSEIIEAVQTYCQQCTTPLLIYFCPSSPYIKDKYAQLLLDAEQTVCSLLKALPVYCFTNSDFFQYYKIASYYDREADQYAHVPYTNVAIQKIGSFIARGIHSITCPMYKVIIVDCDYTLWKGVCGEMTLAEIEIGTNYQKFQQFLIDKQQQGFLICICSKNFPEDVYRVFDSHPNMLLKRENITNWKINWKSKSENIQQISQELDLQTDTFIFIDDNPIECEFVQKTNPEVLVIRIEETIEITDYLNHIWAFDRFKVTQEDQKRTALYAENLLRKTEQKKAQTFKEFIESLNIAVDITPFNKNDVARISQLTQRTNQMNTTTVRRQEAVVLKYCSEPNHACFSIRVHDRFGDYGLVGAAFCRKESSTLIVESFMLSCRVLDRGVEHTFVAFLAKQAELMGCNQIQILYKETGKNQPARNFLNAITGAEGIDTLPIDRALSVTYEPEENVQKPYKPTVKGIITRSFDPNLFYLSVAIDEMIPHEVHPRVQLHFDEKQLVDYLKREIRTLLNLGDDESISEEDNFFDLGLDSLMTMEIRNHLMDTFGIGLPVNILYTQKNINELVSYILKQEKLDAISSKPLLKSYDELYPVIPSEILFVNLMLSSTREEINTINYSYTIQGDINSEKLMRSIDRVIKRHPILHSSIVEKNEQWFLLIDPNFTFSVETKDNLSERINEGEIIQSLSSALPHLHSPLFFIGLYQLDHERWFLYCKFNHLIFDAYSWSLFFEEVMEYYTTNQLKVSDEEIARNYHQYFEWRRTYFYSQEFAEQSHYWKKKLAEGLPDMSRLYDRYPEEAGVEKIQFLTIELPQSEIYQMRFDDSQIPGTRFTKCLTLFSLLIAYLSQQSEIAIGVTQNARSEKFLQKVICSLATCPLMFLRIEEGMTVKDFFDYVYEEYIQIVNYAHIPHRLQKTGYKKRLNVPVFNTYPNVKNTYSFGELTFERVMPTESFTTAIPLNVYFLEEEKDLFQVQYMPSYINESSVLKMFEGFKTLSNTIIHSLDQPLKKLFPELKQ